jgi:hypothetical protein
MKKEVSLRIVSLVENFRSGVNRSTGSLWNISVYITLVNLPSFLFTPPIYKLITSSNVDSQR